MNTAHLRQPANFRSQGATNLCQDFLLDLQAQSGKSLWLLSQLAGVDENQAYKARKGRITLSLDSITRLAKAAGMSVKLTLKEKE